MSASTEMAYGKKLLSYGDPGIRAVAAALAKNKKLDKGPRNWAELALHLGITKQAIDQWKRVPIEHAITLETWLDVPRSVMRPEVYPPASYSVGRFGSRKALAGAKKRRH